MKILKLSKLAAAFVFFLLLAANVVSQESPATGDEPIKVETLLLNVPVIVSDRDGRYISGLKIENFYINENGTTRPPDFFADADSPISVAILVDTSFSTTPILDDIKAAAGDFLQVLRPEDQAMIASFDTRTKIWSEFTSDKSKLQAALEKMNSRGDSTMYDAVYLLMKKYFAPVRGRKAIIVLTDGMVGGRGVSEKILLNELAESDVVIYPLMFSADTKRFSDEMIKKFSINNQIGAENMTKFSAATGGKLFAAKETDFREAFTNIAQELKNQYVIGFYPSNFAELKNFRVGLKPDSLKINSRNIVLRIKKKIQPKKKDSAKKPNLLK